VFLEEDDVDAPPLPRVPLGQPVAQPAAAGGFASKERLGALRPATAPGGGLPRLPATQAPASFYGAPPRGVDPAGASSSAAAAARSGNHALVALIPRKAAGDAPGRTLRRDRSDASLPASDGGGRREPAKKRRKAHKHYGHQCTVCGSRDRLEVHHRHYRTLYRESVLDLDLLCHDCHSKHHEGLHEHVCDSLTSEFIALVRSF
jgi:hypothetical protein